MKNFKIECTVETLETIMTALRVELERQTDTNSEAYRRLSEAIAAVADFTTN